MSSPDRTTAVRDRIRANFDRGAEAYQRFEEQAALFRSLLDRLLAMAPPLEGARVLDVGCGTGASTRALLEAVGPGGSVVGLDISLGMLRVAGRNVGGACFLLGDACSLGRVVRGPFDAVVYNAVLFMLPDAEASLDGARQVLAPGGVVLVSHLEGVYRASDGTPVPEVLASRGLRAGRHALTPWGSAVKALEARFPEVETRRLGLPMTPERFAAFYGLEPMSAGLLPRTPYPERREAVEALAREWRADGDGAEQVWQLACARTAPQSG